MPISFLNPTLLLGTLAAALPVIIHFLSRRKVRRQPFSDLRFLDEVQARQARSLGVRRWLLLLLRVLALLCVALAAAGPRWGGLDGGVGTRSLLFVIDTSASMNTGQSAGTRLDEAVRACDDMIRALPGDTAVQVLTAGSRTRALFGDWLPAGADAAAGLSLVQPSDGTFDPARVFSEAARLVARAPGSPVQIVLLSDLQATSATPADWEAAARRLREAGQTHLLVRRIGSETAGGAVLSVDLPGRAVRPGENVTVRARVVPQFAEQVFVLELDGRPVGEVVTAGAPGQAVDIAFPLTVPGVGRHLGNVRKESDALPGDDSRPFVLEVPRGLDVLLVHGPAQPRDGAGGAGGWRYLAEALQPGGGPSAFRTRAAGVADLTTGDISGADVVLFVDPEPLGRRVHEHLLTWLQTGGQAVFLVGDPRLTAYLAETLLPDLGLPEAVGYTAVGEPGQRARILDPGHPVFQGLEAAALTTFEDVAWRRWFQLQEGPGRVVVSLTGDDPLVIEATLGQGRAVVLPFDLTPAASDLMGSPMALPFFQRLVAWLAGGEAAGVNTEAGREAVLLPRESQVRALLERGDDLRVLDGAGSPLGAATLVWGEGGPRLEGGVIERAGFITFLSGADTVGVVAAGTPSGESEPRLQTPADFGRRLAELGLAPAADLTGDRPDRLMATLGGHDLAPWLLVAALLLLGLELGLGRGSRT